MKKTAITIIIIIIVCAILTGLIVWYFRPEEDSGGSLPTPPEKEVTVATDKEEYRYGEIVMITAKNDLDNSIWYIGNIPYEYPWWGLEKYNQEEDIWEEIDIMRPLIEDEKEECIFRAYEQIPIDELVVEVQADTEITDQWDLKNCYLVVETVPEFEVGFVEPGTYRLFFKYVLDKESYSQESSLEETIYSNEFVIKGEIRQMRSSRRIYRPWPYKSWLYPTGYQSSLIVPVRYAPSK